MAEPNTSIKYYFIQDEVTKGSVNVVRPSTDMVADVLTKGLYKDQFMKFRRGKGFQRVSRSV